MRLYAGSSRDFIRDSAHNRIGEQLRAAFQAHFGYEPPASERRSWREPLRALAQVLTEADLSDHGVILGYQLPQTSKRVDCLITGHDADRRSSAVMIQLKQWEQSELTEGEDLVRALVGGTYRDVLHPCAQANQYRRYLADMHEAFQGENAVALTACSYLHNYHADADDAILSPRFDSIRSNAPLFTADAVPALVEHLGTRLQRGNGMPVLERIERSRLRPSQRLLDHVHGVLAREPRFVLLDEQLVVFNRVLSQVRAGLDHSRKHVFLIQGGPGTGKSVLAINLLSELAALGRNTQYATGSRALTATLRKIVGVRAGQLFNYFRAYGQAEPGIVDVLICDESHRIRTTSNSQFTRKTERSSRQQVQELIDASRLIVFFIDDRQLVRPGEIGSSKLIREVADRNNCILEEHQLEAQFRCQGSANFLNWVENTLGMEEAANPIWDQRQEQFELRIMDSPEALESQIRARNAEGHTARIVAGFCWPWSREAAPDGSLKDDIVIGSYRRPWNARPDVPDSLRKGIPRADLWAFDPRGIDQIGCVYTTQGFEFEYVGVIWGEDLVYDPGNGEWRGDRQKSCDSALRKAREDFIDLLRNTYRVLLTRGLKGCYIYFVDKNTERFVRSRMEALGATPRLAPTPQPAALPSPKESRANSRLRSRQQPLRRAQSRVPQPGDGNLSNATAGIAALKEALSIWETHQTCDDEAFWHGVFDRCRALLVNVSPSPIDILQSKAYLGGKRFNNRGGAVADFLAQEKTTRGAVLIEIKSPCTPLLGKKYRSGAYPLSREISGSVSQVLHYQTELTRNIDQLRRDLNEHLEADVPRCIVIAGNLSRELDTSEKRRCFKRSREMQAGIVVIGFDELFERAREMLKLLANSR